MSTCPKCGIFQVFGLANHRCPPVWHVWWPDGSEEEGGGRDIHAGTPEEACEKWAEDFDCGGDYTVIGGSPEVLCVRVDGEVKSFRVYGEPIPQYRSERVVKCIECNKEWVNVWTNKSTPNLCHRCRWLQQKAETEAP